MLPLCPSLPKLPGSFEKGACAGQDSLGLSFDKTYVEPGPRIVWESYLPSGVCVDDHEMENPDAIILLEEWLDSLSDDGGGTQVASTTPSAHVGDPDVLSSTAHQGSDGDISMSINECNKTLDSVDDVMSILSPMRQLFAGTPIPATVVGRLYSVQYKGIFGMPNKGQMLDV